MFSFSTLPPIFCQIRTPSVVLIALLLLSTSPLSFAKDEKPKQSDYQSIEWTELMPADDLEALLNPPDYINDIPDGSPEDQIAQEVKSAIAKANDDRYQQALVSKRVIPEFDQRKIKLPGYIVPLEFDDDMLITQFFLVPFFGACIHVPPPPPNQMIYINYPKGMKLDNLYDPYYAEGTLHIKSYDSGQLGASAYTMDLDKLYIYTD